MASMLIYRWQSPIIPAPEQIRMFFEREGLSAVEEVYKAGEEVKDHIHPFDEIRMVCQGEILFNIAGNRVLLRGGDKIVIPSNTRHSKKVQGKKDCISFCAFKSF